MAWRSSGKSNLELLENLYGNGIIKSKAVFDAMKKVDRAGYCPRYPYEDRPQPIGFAATISAPHMHAYALEHLQDCLTSGCNALDIGSGSGYLTACMAEMVGKEGKVVGIEHVEGLVNMARKNLAAANPELLDRVEFVVGDGRLGFPQGGPYSCIHVGAASDQNIDTLIAQLKNGGKMFVPVQDAYESQTILLVEKDRRGNVSKKHLMGVMYVPLTSLESQLGHRSI